MSWLEYGFTVEPNLSDREIKQLWQNTQKCNSVIDDLANAKLSLDDACALIESMIPPDQLVNDLYDNFEYLGWL